MSQIRLYVDEDAMRRRVHLALTSRGVDVVTANDASMVRRADEGHLMTATGLRRVLYSYNTRDYQRIHGTWLADGRSHAGIIVAVQQRYSSAKHFAASCESSVRYRSTKCIEYLNSWP